MRSLLVTAARRDCNGWSNLQIAFKSRHGGGSARRRGGSTDDLDHIDLGKHLSKDNRHLPSCRSIMRMALSKGLAPRFSGIRARQEDQPTRRPARARSVYRKHHRSSCRNQRSLTLRGFPHIYAARAVVLPAFRRLHRVEDAPLCIQPVERQSDIIAPPRPRGRAPSPLRLSAGPQEAAARDFAYSKDTL